MPYTDMAAHSYRLARWYVTRTGITTTCSLVEARDLVKTGPRSK